MEKVFILFLFCIVSIPQFYFATLLLHAPHYTWVKARKPHPIRGAVLLLLLLTPCCWGRGKQGKGVEVFTFWTVPKSICDWKLRVEGRTPPLTISHCSAAATAWWIKQLKKKLGKVKRIKVAQLHTYWEDENNLIVMIKGRAALPIGTVPWDWAGWFWRKGISMHCLLCCHPVSKIHMGFVIINDFGDHVH